MTATSRNVFAWCLSGGSLLLVLFSAFYACELRDRNADIIQRQRLLLDLIATTDHGFVAVDPDDRIVEWNVGMEKIFGWTRGEVLGSPPDFILVEPFPVVYHEAGKDNDAANILSPHVTVAICWAYRKGGELIPVTVVTSDIRNHIGWYRVALVTEEHDLAVIKASKPVNVTPSLPKPRPIRTSSLP